MHINILTIVAGLALLSSCSSAYKTGQTPDDVYYSPSKKVNSSEYLAVRESEDRYRVEEDYDTYRNDRFMRMSIGNPYRMSAFNDFYWNDWRYGGFQPGFSAGFNNFGYGSIGFGSNWGMNSWGMGYLNPWAGPLYWNSFYNPYAFNYGWGGIGMGGWYGGGIKTPIVNPNPSARPSVFNPRVYNSSNSGNVNNSRNYYNPRTGNYSNYNNSNNNSSGSGRTGIRSSSRDTYYNTNNNRSSGSERYNPPANVDRPLRTYTPAPSGGGGGFPSRGGTGGGGGGVGRPTRGN